MTDLTAESRTFVASDGYPLNVAVWMPASPPRAQVVLLHGVQSHSGWYQNLGSVLASRGFEVTFPHRRGSGPHTHDRGHARSASRLLRDLAEWLDRLKLETPDIPIIVGGISWGGKLAVVTAARHPAVVSAIALICPGLHPRVGLSLRDKLAIGWAYLTNRRRTFPIPLSDPALFTASRERQDFIASDPLSLREATAGLLVASVVIDCLVRLARRKVHQPALLMLAGQDRIVDNASTLGYFERMGSSNKSILEYAEGHHTLEFEPDPSRYALDLADWIDRTCHILRSREP
jgi:alpha-beta hydrolase superfamily lysophospholipase